MTKGTLLLGFLCAIGLATVAQKSSDDIIGVWLNGEGTAHIQLFKNHDKYQGKIVWLKEPIDKETGKPRLDKNHPDKSVRSRPILGLSNVWGFTYIADKKQWTGGFVYDPKNGKTYDCRMWLENANTLKVRGFIMGMSMLGRTDTWTRQ
jgi:uncharacterized protein (DUF2147 family)